MKLRCRNCGTAFDYEKHEGYCPRCASFNDKPEKPVKPAKAAKPAKRRVWQEDDEFLNVRKLILAVALVLIMVLGVPIAGKVAKVQYMKERNHPIPSTEIAIGEELRFDRYKVSILGATVHELTSKNRLLQVEYKGSDPWVAGVTKVYLYVDGEFQKPYQEVLSFRRLLSDGDPYIDQIKKDSYTTGLELYNGYLGFHIPEEAEEIYLLIVEYDQYDARDEMVRQPVQKWKIPIEGVES